MMLIYKEREQEEADLLSLLLFLSDSVNFQKFKIIFKKASLWKVTINLRGMVSPCVFVTDVHVSFFFLKKSWVLRKVYFQISFVIFAVWEKVVKNKDAEAATP